MSIDFHLVTIIVFALISQGIFASVILLLKHENKAANRYLSVLSFLLALWLCDTFFQVAGIFSQNPNFYFLPIYYSFGFGPLIYFYTKKLTNEKSKFGLKQALHLVPVFIQFLFYLFLQINDYNFRRNFWIEIHKPLTYDLELVLSFLSLIIYLFLSRKLIHSYKLKIENSFSNIHTIALQWLNWLHLILAILCLIWLIESLARLFWGYYFDTPFSSITVGIILIFTAIGAILQKDLYPFTSTMETDTMDESEINPAFSFNPQELEIIQKMMTEKELFLRQELTLKEFANEVKMPIRQVSKLINHGLNMKFIDFVNQFRVNRFKELAQNTKLNHLSLIGLAFDSGFNSKSTFNRVFKKIEGKSPSDYLNASQNMF